MRCYFVSAAAAILVLLCCLVPLCVAASDVNYDFVIAGGGAAACRMAAKLADHPARPSVLVLEQGDADDSRVDGGIDAYVPKPEWTDQIWYHPIEQPAAVTRKPPTIGHRAMGGNTRVYGHVNNRPSRTWLNTRMPSGYRFEDLLPYMKADEDHYCYYLAANLTGISPADCHAYHGQGGPMKVAFPSLPHISSPMKAFINHAAATPGYGFTADYNNPNSRTGFAWEQHWRSLADSANSSSLPRSRVNPWNAFLSPSFRASHPNLVIKTRTFVERLIFNGPQDNRVRGVFYSTGTETFRALANKEVVLALGVIDTPAFLQRNGIGPADLLLSKNITVRVDNPAVGAGLAAHQGVFNAYRLNQPLYNDARFHGVGVAAAHLNTRASDLPANVQLEILEGVYAELSDPLGPSFDIISDVISAPPTDPLSFQRFLGVVIINNVPNAAGTVNITSADPRQRPQLDYGWSEDSWTHPTQGGLAVLQEAYTRVRNLVMGSSTFNTTYGPTEVYPDNRWRDRLASKLPLPPGVIDFVATQFYIRYSVQPFFHVTSSCRLGACTDLEGRVTQVTGLNICDNSLLPSAPDANPTTVMLAMCSRVADHILSRHY